MNEVKKMKYARATYGSLAYDFNRAAQPEIEYPELPQKSPQRTAEKKAKVNVQKNVKTASKPKTRTMPLGALGYMVCACMMILVLMGYVRLTKISTESSNVQKQITDLKNTQAKLKVQYESTFDLTKVEQYAVGRLGMMPATNSQIYYLNKATPDKAVIISDKSKAGVLSGVTTFLSNVVEYFK